MIHGVLFDKDDTLLDLATFWRAPVQRTVDFMLRELRRENDQALRHALECAAGFDGDALIAESPVVAGTNADVVRACMDVLAAQNIDVIDQSLFARLAETYLEIACLRDGVCQPTGDLAHVLDALHAQNIRTGVATSDSFASTMHALEKMASPKNLTASSPPTASPAQNQHQIWPWSSAPAAASRQRKSPWSATAQTTCCLHETPASPPSTSTAQPPQISTATRS